MAPVLGSLQQIPPLQDNLMAIEPWHLEDMSVMERQRRETNKYLAEHQHDNDLARTAKSLAKRSILEEEDLEWYLEDFLEDYIANNLIKRGTSETHLLSFSYASMTLIVLGNVKDKAKDAADRAKDAVDNAADNAKGFVDDAKSGFKDAADQAKDHAGTVEDKANEVCGHCKDGGSDVGDALEDAKDAIKKTIKEVKDSISRAN